MSPHVSLAIALALAAPAQDPSPGSVPDAVQGITARELGGHMRFLASDLMRGRDTASDEIRLVGEYLASRLYAAGAEPGGDGGARDRTFFQGFPLEVVTPRAEGTGLTVTIERDDARREIPCTLGTDFFLFPRGVAVGEVEGPVVFGGKDATGEDEMNAFAALEVKNRFVMFVSTGRPQRGRNGPSKAEEARKRGALGLLFVPPQDGAPQRATATGRGAFDRPSLSLGTAPATIPSLNLTEAVRDGIFGAVGPVAGPDKPGPLDGVRASFRFDADREAKQDRNVIGVFPGSDPEKKNEVIIFSAHYDHVGVDAKGEIFNGSDDNASGTSGLLEIAEAFGDGPRPARSVAFLWVSGEEKGLLGSSWFADHVSLPSEYKIVADINLDMISRNDAKSVGVTPSPKHGDYSTLIPAAEEALKAEGMEPKFDADQYYGRTDSFNFARKGIPVVFIFSGVHDDYHKATDDVDKADFEKAARIARAAYRLGYQMAQAPEAPKKIKAEETAKAEDQGEDKDTR